MTTPTAPAHRVGVRSAETLKHRTLAVLGLHRMATTLQLTDLLAPAKGRKAMSQALNELREQELVQFITLPAGRHRAWFLSQRGANVTRDWPELRGRPPYPVTDVTAASLRTAHTLTSVRAHLAFVQDARRRGEEHGPLDWTPEVAHDLPDSERLIADALFHYTAGGSQRRKLRAFVEIDRATMSSERMASKLIDYARFRDYIPAPVGRRSVAASQRSVLPVWQRWYPAYPRVLFILTGAGKLALSNRVSDLRAMVAEHPQVAAMARTVPLGAAVLEDLEEHGPSAPVWWPLDARKEQMSWMDL